MFASNQQTLADLGANERPPMLEKENYIPWESRFRRFLDNKLEEGEQMWRSIEKGPYVRPMIHDPDDTREQILEPLSKMTDINKKQYIANVKVTNYLLQVIPMISTIQYARLMDEFDKFAAKKGESLESVYERLTTLVNIIDRNNVCPIPVSINTKFLNCLQPEWSKYVTMVRHNKTGDTVSYDQLYDSLVYFEPHVQASKAKRAAKNHDPLALIAHSNASSLQSHACPSYSHSPQPYYVTHPSLTVKYEEDCQGELQGDSQDDKLTTDGRVDIQTKNEGYGGNGNRNAGRENKNQAYNAGNGNDKSHYARDCQKPRVRDAKHFREQMLLAMKDEAESNLNDEENDFMLDDSYGDEILEELTATAVSEVNASHKVHEQANHVKRKTVINTSADDQIDSNIRFDDPYVENNGGSDEHDSNDHDQYHDVKILAYNALREAENKKTIKQ
ncbi:hypothetical protein Tco_0873346 [Tanacetum coccineum]